METSDKIVLVTGGSGFVGLQCILQLLQQGYTVRTTLRDINKKDKVLDALKNGGVKNLDQLSFVEADLTNDKNWNVAMSGCTYVLHVASPIGLELPKHEDDMIRPAVDGTLRVLKTASDAGVKRVVMTSNFGAVGYSHKDKTTLITEESWTDPNEKGLSAYNKSKVLAERAAWDFMKQDGGSLELSVVNPMGIFGPALNADLSSGFGLLQQILNGTMKAIPNITLGIVDVRDVADLHLRAMINPAAKGQRYLALAGGVISLPQIVKLLKEHMPEVAKNASTKTMPDWLVRLVALFSKKAKGIVPLLGVYRNASNQKARTQLGWQPRSNEEAILATAESLVHYKNV
jgi:nucleoside-diphosphate-sugar epimerase